MLVICIIYYYSGLAALLAYFHLLNPKGCGDHAEPRASYPASCLTVCPAAPRPTQPLLTLTDPLQAQSNAFSELVLITAGAFVPQQQI